MENITILIIITSVVIILFALLCDYEGSNQDQMEGFYGRMFLPYGYSHSLYGGYGYRYGHLPYYSHSGYAYNRPIYQEYDDGRNNININVGHRTHYPWYSYLNPYNWW